MNLRIGLDIGGTKVHGIAVDADSPQTILADSTTDTRPGPDGVVESARESLDRVRAQLPMDAVVQSIGLGVPGIVDKGVVSHAVNLGLAEEALPLAERFAPYADGARVVVENDVKAAALGAAQWLANEYGSGDDLALLNVGTGLAAGMILDGRLRHGSHGMAGEIGHLVIDADGPPCSCGKRGCLELYASGSGIRRQWEGTSAELFAAAEAGNSHAGAIRDQLVAGLARAVRALVHICDVESVVLTGGVVAATPALRVDLVAYLDKDEHVSGFERMAAVSHRLRWLPADYPAGAIGAALLGGLDPHNTRKA